MEFLGVLIPRAKTLAALYNPANPSNLNFLPGLRSQCDAFGISLVELAFKSTVDWSNTLSNLPATRRPDALFLVADSFLYDQADRVAALALGQRIPTLATGVDAA